MDFILDNFTPVRDESVRQAIRKLEGKEGGQRQMVNWLRMKIRRENTDRDLKDGIYENNRNLFADNIGVRMPRRPPPPPYDPRPEPLEEDRYVMYGGGADPAEADRQLSLFEEKEKERDAEIERWEKKYERYVKADNKWLETDILFTQLQFKWRELYKRFYSPGDDGDGDGDGDDDSKTQFCALHFNFAREVGVLTKLIEHWMEMRRKLLKSGEGVSPPPPPHEKGDELREAFEDMNTLMDDEPVAETLRRLVNARYSNIKPYPLSKEHLYRDTQHFGEIPIQLQVAIDGGGGDELDAANDDAMREWSTMNSTYNALVEKYTKIWNIYYSLHGGGGGGSGVSSENSAKFCALRDKFHRAHSSYLSARVG